MKTIRLNKNLRLRAEALKELKDEFDAELHKENGWWVLSAPTETISQALIALTNLA